MRGIKKKKKTKKGKADFAFYRKRQTASVVCLSLLLSTDRASSVPVLDSTARQPEEGAGAYETRTGRDGRAGGRGQPHFVAVPPQTVDGPAAPAPRQFEHQFQIIFFSNGRGGVVTMKTLCSVLADTHTRCVCAIAATVIFEF